jgi:Tfp pilus assembly protein PilV
VKSGSSLAEVIVALVVLEVAILGSLGIVVLASRTLADAEATERAVAALEGTADSLSVSATPGEGHRDIAGGRIRWSVEEDGGFVVSFERDGRVSVRVAGVALLGGL